MPVTQLADLQIVPALFSLNMTLDSLKLDAFVQSGVVTRDTEIDAFLNGPIGGKTFNPRFLGPLDDEEENISNDDPADKSVPAKIGSVLNTAVRQSLNKSWSSMDLCADLNGADPLAVVQAQIAKYWLTRRQRRVLASLKGVIGDSVANHASDMVRDISGESGAAGLINANAIVDARATLGDRSLALTGMAVHSAVFATMQKLNLIGTIPYSVADINFPSYLGMPVLVDDGMTVDGATYYTYLFGAGAVALGMGSPKVPFEVQRTPEAGHGGGQETVYSRVEHVIHPQGYKFALADTPTIAQLENAANWERAWERKRIPLACLISNG